MKESVLWKVLIFSTLLKFVASNFLSPQFFSRCNAGELSYKNRAGLMKILICPGEKNGVPQWQFSDGSSTVGEVFNPARDCSEIVDHLPDAKDGFYWISLKNQNVNNHNKHEVWCDVHTDGGGFMLVGMNDGPESYSVPSNSSPVNPRGPPHWSSVLGDIQVLDFGVQFLTDKTFQGSEAHWFYRLKPTRKLGNLFTNEKSSGCTKDYPGIGHVMFVKDVLTKSVVTKNFRCSIFGPHFSEDLGWAKMNQCFRHDCKDGYSVFREVSSGKIKETDFGFFSYSAISNPVGTQHKSTAFVGCHHGKCCACFGPKGGRQNYCGPKCTAINGGTVVKKVTVWFWVRTRMPKRLWKRCMEFTMKTSAGRLEKYFIDRRTGTAHKGSCSEQFKTFLNEGTMTASDKESFNKIPDVPGLLSYRKDNKKLYVNEGTKWQALSNEQEVQHLQQEVKSLENTIQIQQNNIQNVQKTIRTQEKKIQTQEKNIDIQQNKNRNRDKTIQEQGSMIKNLEKRYKGMVDLANMLKNSARTCSVLQQYTRKTLSSGKFTLYPQGHRLPAQVYCDMTSKNGAGVTVIGHDSNSRTHVTGYEASGSYSRKIKYDIPMEQIVAIIKQSKYCEQFIKYECFGSGLWLSSGSKADGWWVSRQGSRMNYWGGATVNSGKCACGMTNNCAGGKPCNCDKNDKVWREDRGYLTDKNTLPVSELRFGDTGDVLGNGKQESGYHTLGKLRCWD